MKVAILLCTLPFWFIGIFSHRKCYQKFGNKRNPWSHVSLITKSKGCKSSQKLPQTKFRDRAILDPTEDFRRYVSITYRHLVGYDTLNGQLKICKNIFTFFVENPDLPALKRFKDAGFPMEFWSTSMCSFYGVPVNQVSHYIKKAESLGYNHVGYDAILITEKDTTAFVLSNLLNVHFDRRTAQQDIHEVMKDIPGIQLEGGSLAHAFVVSVSSNKLSDILDKFKVLKNHRLVKFLEFIPESCELLL